MLASRANGQGRPLHPMLRKIGTAAGCETSSLLELVGWERREKAPCGLRKPLLSHTTAAARNSGLLFTFTTWPCGFFANKRRNSDWSIGWGREEIQNRLWFWDGCALGIVSFRQKCFCGKRKGRWRRRGVVGRLFQRAGVQDP